MYKRRALYRLKDKKSPVVQKVKVPIKKVKKDKKSGEADIFAAKKERFVPNEQRKKDQKEVDSALLKVIKAHPEGKFFAKYLQNMFALHSSQYPHRMRF